MNKVDLGSGDHQVGNESLDESSDNIHDGGQQTSGIPSLHDRRTILDTDASHLYAGNFRSAKSAIAVYPSWLGCRLLLSTKELPGLKMLSANSRKVGSQMTQPKL
jgi:hypothetical protein